MIPFGPWLPDLPVLENPGTLTAENVIPYGSHYSPWKDLTAYTNALTDRCRGAAAGIDGSFNTFVFAGDETNLYRLNNATWTDVSGATYTTGADEHWSFDVYRNRMIATNYSDAVQTWLMGTDAAFSNLGTNVPKARHITTIRNFAVLGNVNDTTDGQQPFRVAWSPINDPTGDWTPDVDTQAGEEDLVSGLQVMGLIGGEFGIVLMQESVYRMVYVGQPVLFQFDEIEGAPGVAKDASGSVATFAGRSFYYAEDGFYTTDGTNFEPIGANKFDEFFKADVNASEFSKMSSVIDPARKLYVLSYVGSNSTGTPNRLLVYNWESGWASIVNRETQQLARLVTAGYTLEQLDNISSSLDAFPSSLDSRDWQGGAIIFGGFDADNKFGLFGGGNLQATIGTSEVQLGAQKREENQLQGMSGFRSVVGGLRAIVDTNSWTARVGTRNLPGDSVTWSALKTPNSRNGVAPFREDARYHRGEVVITAGATWDKAQGIDIDATVTTFV